MKRTKTGKRILSWALSLVLILGLMPGMSLTAYAAGGTEVTKANVICQQYSYDDAYDGTTNKYSLNSAPPTDVVTITLAEAQAFGDAVSCPTTYWVVVYAKDGDNYKWTSNGKTGEQTSSPKGGMGAWTQLLNDDVYHLGSFCDPANDVTFYFSKGLATVGITGVSLNKTTAQTIDVDGKVSFTATVSPDNATNKTVKWSVGGTNSGAVKLYSDANCTTEVGTDATDKLTVYAKGMSAGTATVTVTATNGTDDTADDKSASCNVTVNPVTYEVTYKVANGTWSDGGTTDKTENVQSGSKPASVPTGMKAASGYTGGAWNTDPTNAIITEDKTFTYTFTAKQAATVTKAPTAKTLTYNGSAQALVNAGEAEGGEMQYALGTKDAATQSYSTSIPTATDAGTYYVWYKAVGDADHTDSEVKAVSVTIASQPEPEKEPEEKPEKATSTKNFRTLRLVAKRGKKAVTLRWEKQDKADGYKIYGCECKDGQEMELLKTIKDKKTTTWTRKKLKKGTHYKFRVVAYKKVDGKEQTLVQSVAAHTVTHDGKTTAIKSVKVNKTEVTLKKNETFQIKAKVTKENNKKKVDQHRPICYESSNEKIVKVNDKGKVTAKKKGKAKVFVYCENGMYKKIQFTVK